MEISPKIFAFCFELLSRFIGRRLDCIISALKKDLSDVFVFSRGDEDLFLLRAYWKKWFSYIYPQETVCRSFEGFLSDSRLPP